MTEFTTNLGMGLIAPDGQAHLLHNRAVTLLDLLCGGGAEGTEIDADLLTPAEGEAWIITGGTPASGDEFENHGEQIAIRWNNDWLYITPAHGTRVWDRSLNSEWIFTTVWTASPVASATHARSLTTQATTTSATFAAIDVDTEVHNPGTDFFTEAGGQVTCVTGGKYLVEYSGEVYCPATAGAEVEFGIGDNSATTAVAGSTRRISIGAINEYHAVQISQVVTVTAGHFVAAIWRRVSGTGTPTIQTTRGHLRVTKIAL